MDIDSDLRTANFVVFSLICVTALLGNSLVVLSVWKFDYLKRSANYLVSALALCDMTIAFCTLSYLGKF